MFRHSVATEFNDNASIEPAAALLGHTDTRVTVMHYIQRSELANPATAALLDRAFKRDAGSSRWCHGGATVVPRWHHRLFWASFRRSLPLGGRAGNRNCDPFYTEV